MTNMKWKVFGVFLCKASLFMALLSYSKVEMQLSCVLEEVVITHH